MWTLEQSWPSSSLRFLRVVLQYFPSSLHLFLSNSVFFLHRSHLVDWHALLRQSRPLDVHYYRVTARET